MHWYGRLHAEGFRILRDLPGALHGVLDGLVETSGARAGRNGVLKAYGDFYNWIRELPEAGPGRALKEALASHAHANVALKSGTRLDGSTAVVRNGIAVSEASRNCGIGYVRFRRLLDQLDIEVFGEGTGSRAEIRRASYEPLAKRLAGFRTLKQIGMELSLAQEEVAELARAGLIEMIAEGNGTSDWIFPANAAQVLKTRIERMSKHATKSVRSFTPMIVTAKRLRASMAEILRLGLQGKINILHDGSAAAGFDSFYIDPSQVTSIVCAGTGDGLVWSVAARELGFKQSAMDAVVASGILGVRRRGDVQEVDADAIEEFRANYVTMPELRDRLGFTAFQPVATFLSAAGVEPVVRGARLTDYVYLRISALAACGAARRVTTAVARGRNRKEIAADLHMTPLMLRQLVDAGIVCMQEGCPFGSISDAEIERFRADYATSSDLARAFGISGWKTVLAVAAAAGVEPVCRPPDFDAFLFPRKRTEDALRVYLAKVEAIRAAASRPKEKLYDLAEVAEKLGTVRNMAWQMAQKGVLQSRQVGRAIMVLPAEVERFRRDFVLGNELGVLAGRTDARGSGPAITRALLNAGLVPVCARPEFYSYVFERQSATQEMRRLGMIAG